MCKITILVCLYNKDIFTSITVRSLLKLVKLVKNSKFFIWDNSLIPLDKKLLDILKENFENRHTPENVVLSKVYNAVIT